jgi:Zinc-binding loop region of homing endonuclease
MAAAQVSGHASGYDSPVPGGSFGVGEGGFSSPEKAALANFPNTLALNEAWETDGVLEHPEKVLRNPRRTSEQLRADMRALGNGRCAFFLAAEQRPQESFGLDPFKGAGSAKIHPDSWAAKPLDSQVCLRSAMSKLIVLFTFAVTSDPCISMQAAREDFNILRKIFNKGVQVSKDGCIYPHPRYCTSGEGDKRKAYQRVMLGLMGVKTVGEQNKVDEQTGWPIWAEISHLCHHHKCCNPLHLQLQAAWLNRRRNYCGDSGHCDCGSQPPCQLRYSSDNPMQPQDLCSSVEEVRNSLKRYTTQVNVCASGDIIDTRCDPCRSSRCSLPPFPSAACG